MEHPPLRSSVTPHRRLVKGIAEGLTRGPWRVEALAKTLGDLTGRRGGWRLPLARRLIGEFGEGPRPITAKVARFLGQDTGLARVNGRQRLHLVGALTGPPVMWPTPGAPEAWDVPVIVTPVDLARFLGLEPPELDGFADLQGRARGARSGASRHYDYVWRARASSTARLIEAPRFRLKQVQRLLLEAILARIPTHEAAHGFCPGRSIATFAAPHVGRPFVLTMDLRDFFPSVRGAQVVATFLTAGYPEPVARRLAGICTNRVPREVWESCPNRGEGPAAWRAVRLSLAPHLPQGAPTSPVLANLAAHRLDARLTGLAMVSDVRYTRYADDLAFSGGERFARTWRRFATHVAATVLEEGFEVNHRKTRGMPQGVRQRVAGVVVNDHPNVSRDEVDRLKATLHNCLTRGPASQNRDGHPNFRAHLAGRVAHVAMLNPDRGAALRSVLDQIDW
ncbi:MAG: reverse transcriptase family protein [Isosphaeraceae bacterium]